MDASRRERQSDKPRLWIIGGPTATGKTRLAVLISQLLFSRTGRYPTILSADSRQCYRGLDIGAGKDLTEYGPVPYSFIDLFDPQAIATVSDFLKTAHAELDAARDLIVCGGTGYYIRALLCGYQVAALPSDHRLTESWEKSLTHDELRARLFARSPAWYAISDHSSKRRLARALELAQAGIAPAANRPPPQLANYSPVCLLLGGSREIARRRIAHRLDARITDGMIDEGARLLSAGVSADRLRKFGAEYAALADLLSGVVKRDDFRDRLFADIRRLAKGQETFFRQFSRPEFWRGWRETHPPENAAHFVAFSVDPFTGELGALLERPVGYSLDNDRLRRLEAWLTGLTNRPLP